MLNSVHLIVHTEFILVKNFSDKFHIDQAFTLKINVAVFHGETLDSFIVETMFSSIHEFE
jgi:hypothetical protein